jgi:15-cis-phytoene synthase
MIHSSIYPSWPYHPAAWERPLLDKAQQALTGEAGFIASRAVIDYRLEQAYRCCRDITAFHSRTFYLAGLLLPKRKRQAMNALYAFCRVADDIVDTHSGDAASRQAALIDWGKQAMGLADPSLNMVSLAWTDARRRYNIPTIYSYQLLEGVARDLYQARYQNFDDLASYAYGVASTVGLMSMHITGFCGSQAIPFAVELGVALQITNVLRDIGDDWRNGRVYLPLAEMADFGLSEDDLAKGRVDERWRDFMRFQIERNRRLYAEALLGIGLLHPDGRPALVAATMFYAAILDEIEVNDYDVFSQRAHLNAWGKFKRLPRVFRQLNSMDVYASSNLAPKGDSEVHG